MAEEGVEFEGQGEPEWTPARLRETVARSLRDEVGGMSLDNFIVRAHRRAVEKFRDDAAWARLSLDDQAELVHEVAGLPTSVVDDDLAAKQFDALVLRTQLAVLRAEKSFAGLKKKVIELAAALEEMSNIPAIARELALIQEIQGDDFWQDVTAPMLETVRLAQWDKVEAQERQRHQLMEKMRLDTPLDPRQRQAVTAQLEEAAALNVELMEIVNHARAALKQAAGVLQRGRRANLAYHGLK